MSEKESVEVKDYKPEFVESLPETHMLLRSERG